MPFVGGQLRPWSCGHGEQFRKHRLHRISYCPAIVNAELTDENVSQSSQALSELLNLSLICLNLLSLGILRASLLLGVKTQVLQENDLSAASLVDNILNLFSNTIRCKLDLLSVQELLKLWHDWLQGVFGLHLAVWAPQVGHEDHGLRTIVNGIFDCWDGTGNTLGIRNFLIGVKRDVEVDLGYGAAVSGML